MKWFPYKVSSLHVKRQRLTVLLVIFFVFVAVPAMTAGQKSPKHPKAAATAPEPTPPSAPASVPAPASVLPGPVAIPVADVAVRAAELSNLLRALANKLTVSSQIDTIRKSLPEVTAQIDRDTAETMRILQRQPALPTLQTQQQQWQQMQLTYQGWLTELTKRSNELQDELTRLNDLQKIWAMTLDAAKASKAAEAILQQINETIADISAAQAPLKGQLTFILDLQSQVGNEVAKCDTVLARIEQVQQESMSDILVQDSLPVWSSKLWAEALTALPEHVAGVAASYRSDIHNYFASFSRRMPLHAGILAGLFLLFLTARHQVRVWTVRGETFSSALRVFDHPFAAAIAVVLFFATSPRWSTLPAAIKDTFHIIAIVPVIILVRPSASARLFPGLYLLGLLTAMDTVREVFSSEMLIGQVILVMESLAGIAVVMWFLGNLRLSPETASVPSRNRLLQSGSALVLLVLAAGFASAALGYVHIARLMTPGVVVGGGLALALYAFLRVFIGIIAIAFHAWPFRTLRMIVHNKDLLERRIYRFLIWAAVVVWLVRYLNYIGLLEPAMSFGKSVLSVKFERGAFSISPGNVLEFFLTVWAAYLLSAFIRFVLREDVYPRLGVATGKSYAVSSLLHYFILALGFTAAIAAMGVNLTKLTVLTGAFGVGIGFGLQSVVNNFVSGLILLFERPIHVGDTVEVGDLLGEVHRIGIRASTVHTKQGADIIVPNSQLVTENVTNWTLSDRLRRIDLTVGVNYSAAPKEVIKILEEVAQANPYILQNPAPQGLFTGFGDSSINFELRAWTDQFDEWHRIRSEIAIALYDAVYAAGMTFPFPQREVRLLKDDGK